MMAGGEGDADADGAGGCGAQQSGCDVRTEVDRLMRDESMSKSGAKKLVKQRMRERKREQKKKQAKEEKRARKAESAQRMTEDERKQAIDAARSKREQRMNRHRDQRERARMALSSEHQLVLDFQYWWLMTERERKSMAQQLAIVYSSNRRNACGSGPSCSFALHLTALDHSIHSELEQTVPLASWFANMSSLPYKQLMEHEHASSSLLSGKTPIVLSADSENELTELRSDVAYVIGCFVDRNRRKNTTESHAAGEGVETARLPITKYARLKTDTILTVNQVVDILLTYRRTHSWQQAIDYVIPPRKRVNSGNTNSSSEIRNSPYLNQQQQQDKDEEHRPTSEAEARNGDDSNSNTKMRNSSREGGNTTIEPSSKKQRIETTGGICSSEGEAKD